MQNIPVIMTMVEINDRELDEVALGLLSYTSRLANVCKSILNVIVTSPPSEETIKSAGNYGVQQITNLMDGWTLLDRPQLLATELADLVSAKSIKLLVLPHNDLGSTLAPILAAKLDAALLTEVSSFRSKEGEFQLSRSALGVRIAETKSWDGEKPLVITVPLRSMSQTLLPSTVSSSPVVTDWNIQGLKYPQCSTVIKRTPPDPQTVDLTEAEIIFSVGKGCDLKTFDQLKELCRILNVSFGVTRPVWDMGWTGFERMVGQTGRTVAPRLYLALGISGSMHHIGGIKDSRRIVALNIDPKAPIFPNADEGFVADLREVVPLLLERARKSVGGVA